MSKLYVFAIGGSGSRILYPLTMLLAAGMETGNCNEIVPVIIDTDIKNGNVKRTRKVIEKYIAVRNALYSGQVPMCRFFKTQMSPLKLVSIDGANLGSLREVIGEAEMKGVNLEPLKKETGLLFSDDNLNMPLEFGFIGNPNVGTVVLNYLFEHNSAFQEAFGGIVAGDRIILLSSIFGGTGAAGFPLLVNKIKANNALAGCILGSVTAIPYYNVKKDPHKVDDKIDHTKFKINSDDFNPKTVAALSYYDKYIQGQVDFFYYIGDDAMKSEYENILGGKDQENPAHLVELLGALSIIDFSAAQRNADGKTQYRNVILNGNHPESCNLNNIEKNFELKKALVRFWILRLFWSEYLSKHIVNNTNFVGQIGLTQDYLNTGLGQDIFNYFETFKKWAQELKDNKWHSRLFSFARLEYVPNEENIHNCFNGVDIKKGKIVAWLANNDSEFIEYLNAVCKKRQVGNSPLENLLINLSTVIDEVIAKKMEFQD